MKQFFMMLGFCLVALMLQTILFRYVAAYIGNVVPDLGLIFLVLFSVNYGQVKGQVSGFLMGLLKDVLTFSVMGYYAIVNMTIGSIVGVFRGRIYVESIPVALIVLVVATLLKYGVAKLVALFFNLPGLAPSFLSLSFILELLMNSLFGLPIFLLIKFINSKLGYNQMWDVGAGSGH